MLSPNPKQRINGFTLVELVVVIAVLSILTAIGIPTFTCLIKKARASAALSQIINLSKECMFKEAFSEVERFNITNIQGYQIKSDELNNCGDGTNTFLVSVVPEDSINLPTFHYSHRAKQIFYEFKNKSGSNLNECLNWICNSSSDVADNTHTNSDVNNNKSDEDLTETEKAAQCTDVDENGYYKWTNDSGIQTAPAHCGYTMLPGRIGTANMAHRYCSKKWPCTQHGSVLIPVDKVAEFYEDTDFNDWRNYEGNEVSQHPDPEKRIKNAWE